MTTRFVSARRLDGARALNLAVSVLRLGIVQAESPPRHELTRPGLGDTPRNLTTRPVDIVDDFPFRDSEPNLHTLTHS